MKYRFASMTIFLLAIACGGSETESGWLTVAGRDTVTAAEASRIWLEMPESSRQIYLQKEDPSGDFLASIVIRSMLEGEMDRLSVDTLTEVLATGDALIRRRSLPVLSRLLRESISAEVSERDLELYRRLMGNTVWITVTDSLGRWSPDPVHLPELPVRLSEAVAEMEPGETLVIDGGMRITLDSARTTSRELVEAELHREDLDLYATGRIASTRATLRMQLLQRRFAGGEAVRIDSASLDRLVDHYAADRPLVPNDTLVSLSDFALTSEVVAGAVYYERNMTLVSPANPVWLREFCMTILRREAAARELNELFPERIDGYRRDADSVRTAASADWLYRTFVSDSVNINRSDLESLFVEIGPELTVSETRSILALNLNSEHDLIDFRTAVEAGTINDELDSFAGFPSLSADSTNSLLTRPLLPSEIPGRLGDTLFALPPGDTMTWLGPAPYAAGLGHTAVRLVAVHPEHAPDFDEAVPVLEEILSAELENRRYDEWIEELKQTYRPEINTELLRQLPENPADWGSENRS
ncbi:MAG: hypothetical protein GF388_08790 [Candidatus Aegiribacteria sp.]|nr:hypothetical protein [Candidatus Aegiribacteria sp.]MBD3295173.1 hypothetical protein [Candidatus Fermentibacteria bacterium]